MLKTHALTGSAVFLFLAPGTVAGLFPWLIIGWESSRTISDAPLVRFAGLGVIFVAGAGLLDSFLRFALDGQGTPAPPMPTSKLVTRGLYRWVRNPMYVAVFGLIVGQALLFQSAMLVLYGALVWIAFHIFVLFFEERRLIAEFSEEYETYCRNVPRWIPRFRPWRPEGNATES